MRTCLYKMDELSRQLPSTRMRLTVTDVDLCVPVGINENATNCYNIHVYV